MRESSAAFSPTEVISYLSKLALMSGAALAASRHSPAMGSLAQDATAASIAMSCSAVMLEPPEDGGGVLVSVGGAGSDDELGTSVVSGGGGASVVVGAGAAIVDEGAHWRRAAGAAKAAVARREAVAMVEKRIVSGQGRYEVLEEEEVKNASCARQ